MGYVHQAIPQFEHREGPVQFTVNAWTFDNVFASDDVGLAYRADGTIRVNPARLLLNPKTVMTKILELEAWPREAVAAAMKNARKRLREHFPLDQDPYGIVVSLGGGTLRVPSDSDDVIDLAKEHGMKMSVVHELLLDHARYALANWVARESAA